MPRGTINERSRGVWQVQVSAGQDPETGKRRRLTSTVHGSKKAANRALTELLTEVDDGAHRGPDASLSRLLDAWWEHASNGWQPATKRGYRSYRTRYLDEYGDTRLSDITGEWCDRLYRDLLKKLSPSTVYKVHVMLHQALGTAVRWGWLRWNPVDRANPPTVQRRQPTTPDRAKLKAAVVKVAATDTDYSCMLHLQAVAGLRRAELAGLKWSDLDGSELNVRRTVVLTDEGNAVVIQDDTKTHRARRIPLDRATTKMLAVHRGRWEDRCQESGATLAGGFMFPRLADPSVPMHPNSMTQRWARWRTKLDLDGVRLHDFRHAMVTHLLDSGIPVHDVAARAGHANGNVTLAIYAHPTTAGAVKAGKAARL